MNIRYPIYEGVYRILTEEVKTGNSPETCRRQEMPGQKPSDRQRQARHAAPIAPQKKEKKQLIL